VSASLIALITALADDELIIGHRHSEWTGHAPHLEEDVAFSSIAQDEIGHAAVLYSLTAEATGHDPDRLAFGRAVGEYRNAILCERPNGDWAYTLARHWLYDLADDMRLECLQDSAHDGLRAVVTKLRREERYHLLHADTWIKHIARGPIEGRARLIEAMPRAFGDAVGLFEPIELEDEAIKDGWLPTSFPELGARFRRRAADSLDGLGLPAGPARQDDETAEFVASSSGDLIAGDGDDRRGDHEAGLGGRRGRHSPDFDALWDEMTVTYRENPGASW
jgi:ring-1,2-phenylacetyl-CoA epoxidase subunit PaaC